MSTDLRRSPRSPVWTTVLIPVVFLLLAGFFWFVDAAPDLPLGDPPRIESSRISTSAPRQRLTDPPQTRIGPYDYTCSECHGIFATTGEPPVPDFQHQEIHLDHGSNDRCLNCHDREDRNRLVLHGEETVGFDQSQELCVKCHGTTASDWREGSHGRTVGHWDPRFGQRRRLLCVECHDPHAPAYEGIRPLPGPHTLRMDEVEPQHHAYESPLMRWIDRPHASEEDDHGH